MEAFDQAICEVTATIWTTVLGLDVHPKKRHFVDTGDRRTVGCCVHITGAWQGAVAVLCSAELARQAAAILFELDAASATLEQTQDVIAELANMTSGNLKTLMPEPSRLSLPTVVEGHDFKARIPGSRLVASQVFECLGEPFQVTLVERADPLTTK
jgi:chemotaxis protein CheX